MCLKVRVAWRKADIPLLAAATHWADGFKSDDIMSIFFRFNFLIQLCIICKEDHVALHNLSDVSNKHQKQIRAIIILLIIIIVTIYDALVLLLGSGIAVGGEGRCPILKNLWRVQAADLL